MRPPIAQSKEFSLLLRRLGLKALAFNVRSLRRRRKRFCLAEVIAVLHRITQPPSGVRQYITRVRVDAEAIAHAYALSRFVESVRGSDV